MKHLNKIRSPRDLKSLNIKALNILCKEIRQFLVSSLAKTGGHLSSNLGVVELTVALHYCLNSPKDKIIWDVGHQAYIHKILTGRMNKFNKLRKYKGLSGFPKCIESNHDAFEVGHSSTSISAALGFCVARDLDKDDYNVVAVIGDGSMTAGLSFEGLNNAGRSNKNFIIILNDNDMSINKNVGGLSKHLNEIRTAPAYISTKQEINNILNKIPMGNNIGKGIDRLKETVKYMVLPGIFFEELGVKYFGGIDGHNIKNLIKVINKAKRINGPVILHVHTVKGKGYKLAEEDPEKYHGVEPFNLKTGQAIYPKPKETYSSVFGETLLKIAENNEKIVVISAAMCSSVGLSKFFNKYPERSFDVGIAESHGVTFSAGLSKNGYLPIVAIYSTFLQRAYDQILHDICTQNLHVIFCIDRAGLVGADGETHQGIFDIAYLSHIPNMAMMSPKNKIEFIKMIEFATKHTGPIAIRYPRGTASNILEGFIPPIEFGKSEYISSGEKIALLSLGSMMDICYSVYQRLLKDGYNPTLINCRFIKPLDLEMASTLEEYDYVYLLEEHVELGGLGSILLQSLSNMNKKLKNFTDFCLPNEFIEQGSREELFKYYKIDANSIYERIKCDLLECVSLNSK